MKGIIMEALTLPRSSHADHTHTHGADGAALLATGCSDVSVDHRCSLQQLQF